MSANPLTFGLFSKGRLKEQAEAWIADCGLTLEAAGGDRGYVAAIRELPGLRVLLLSAADIALALDAGEIHLGVSGEDLLREREAVDAHVLLLRALDFGRADLVVAAPASWLDVETMADLEEVGAAYAARTGRRMRVATKYMAQTRAFFAAHGVVDYRIVESSGATEGSPQAGQAELIVDITTTGATLRANGLRPLADGLILKSQAQLCASLAADWTREQFAQAARLIGVVEARARALATVLVSWPAEQENAARSATEPFLARGATRRAQGLLAGDADLLDVTDALAGAGVGPVSVVHPNFAFAPASDAAQALARRLGFAA
ncbi:MAG TPA: ATP phosphoribosyltransferase [Caulobacteraceae bacterium]|nr:ATP phosphoribosyltransferase [Caulobacteraceae bacterium]